MTVYDRRSAAELAAAIDGLEGRAVALSLGIDAEAATRLVLAADLLVSSPSISPRFPTTDPWLREALVAVEARGGELVSEMELFLRLTRSRILGITGTKGKTTTTALIGAILEAAGSPHVVGGNIGTPLIEQADTLDERTWAVLELSELQLPTISRGADVAVYTNILADHLDRHGTVEAYRAVKSRLARLTVEGGGEVILNADDPGCEALGRSLGNRGIHWYLGGSGEAREAWEADGWLYLGRDRLLPIADVTLPGAHLRADVLAASLGARLAGVAPDAIARGIRGFRGVPHRLETLGRRAGVRWVNDSQATIPAATIAALDAFDPSPVVLIAGGKDKGLDYRALADRMADRCRAVVLIGETAEMLARLVAGRAPLQRAGSMDEAVRIAATLARTGDVLLLSPAATSFDMFADYAARGDAFRAAAAALGVGPDEPAEDAR